MVQVILWGARNRTATPPNFSVDLLVFILNAVLAADLSSTSLLDWHVIDSQKALRPH